MITLVLIPNFGQYAKVSDREFTFCGQLKQIDKFMHKFSREKLAY